ncbi:MAG: spermidine/putrescine ABC transporter substrate-binding protein [Jatrophihabitantaceae bacterium]
MSESLPPDIARGLALPRMSRRRALQVGGLSALSLSLAACGIPGAPGSKLGLNAARKQIKTFWQDHPRNSGQLNFENWPLYIDVGKGSDHPSLDLFTKQTGIKVKYGEDIQDDDSYFGKIQPVLAAGQGIGWDIIVITNGIFLDKLVELDYLTPLDQNAMPNFYKYASPLVLDPSFDRGNVYTMAWQSGMTGIGYNPKYVKKEITSWQDLTDPAYKGKIGMFADIEDTPNSALCAIGVSPENSTQADWKKAAAWLTKQRPLVRKYYQQDYIAPLSKGDLWISLAWSGDIFQANASGADLKFVIPKEGAPLWTDNMCIPVHADHPRDAMTYLDFVYQPKIATMLAEGINYVTPVPATQQLIQQDADAATATSDKASLTALAQSPLIFPSKSDYSRLHRYRVLDAAELTVWDSLFEPIYQS